MLPLHTTLLNHEELATAASRLSAIWNPLFATEPLLGKIGAAAETHRAAIVQAMSRKTTSDFTDPLKEQDNLRDAAFTTLRDLIASGIKNPTFTPEQKAASARLQQIFDRHGNTLHRHGYTRQSGLMDALIADLQAAGPTTDLAAVSLAPLFAQMVQAQADFETLMADKAAAESGQSLPTITEHRPPLEHHLNLLLSSLATWIDLDPTPALTEAAGRIDEVIVSIMTPALARRTKAQPGSPPTPAPQG